MFSLIEPFCRCHHRRAQFSCQNSLQYCCCNRMLLSLSLSLVRACVAFFPLSFLLLLLSFPLSLFLALHIIFPLIRRWYDQWYRERKCDSLVSFPFYLPSRWRLVSGTSFTAIKWQKKTNLFQTTSQRMYKYRSRFYLPFFAPLFSERRVHLVRAMCTKNNFD